MTGTKRIFAADQGTNARRPPSTSWKWTAAFLLLLLVISSRGVFEVLVGKNAGYIIQLVVVAAFFVGLLSSGRTVAGRNRAVPIALYTFYVAAIVSYAITVWAGGPIHGWLYLAAMIVISTMLALTSAGTYPASTQIAFGPVVSAVVLILILVAVAQQFAGFAILPGSDTGTFGSFVRPSSLTGSYLHYPIVLSLLSVTLLGIGVSCRSAIQIIVALLGVIGVLVSLSRSGMVLILFAAVAAVLISRTLSSRLRLIALFGLAGIIALVFFPVEGLVDRFASIFDGDGAGNGARIAAWNVVVDQWLSSPLVFGDRTGEYTNVSTNFASTEARVAESSLLQQLVNFGLVGALSFYALLTYVTRATSASVPWFRAAAIAAIAQSLFYQSVEVLPFMVCFSLIPLISKGRMTASTENSGRDIVRYS